MADETKDTAKEGAKDAAAEKPTEKPAAKAGTAAAAKPEPKADQTIPGGRYHRANGTLVNAHGQAIDESGKVLKKEPK